MKLGSGLINPLAPWPDWRQFDTRKEVCRMLVVAGRDGPEQFLDAPEEALDPVALLVEFGIELVGLLAVRLVRDVRRRPGILDHAPDPLGVVGLVAEDGLPLADPLQQGLAGRRVVDLTRRDQERHRQPHRVDEGVDLRGQSSPRPSHVSKSTVFFTVAAAW